MLYCSAAGLRCPSFHAKEAKNTEILVVDTDLGTHDALVKSVKEAFPNGAVHEYYDPLLALKYGVNNDVGLLITAVRMRGADGPQLCRLLRHSHPAMKVVFVNDGPLRRSEDMDAAPDAVLQLPVTPAALLEAQREWQEAAWRVAVPLKPAISGGG